MDSLHYTDGRSVLGTIASITLSWISVNDFDIIVKTITGVGAVAAIVTTVWYNILKIKKLKDSNKTDEEEE